MFTTLPRGLRAAAVALGLCAVSAASALPSTLTFESGQVRPLALSADGKLLFAVNTPDNRLEIFRVQPGGLKWLASVTVGLEPVAVASRGPNEVWVVNHLSDSISVVDVQHPQRPAVVRTLLVGDEPRDVVFAGPAKDRAFITTAHRGQNSPVNPAFSTPGVGRADVWVFDANACATESTPLTILTLFTDTPRALAVSPDGHTVYAAGFHTGNGTSVVQGDHVLAAGGLPPPLTNFEGIEQPENGLIVRFDYASGRWLDELGRDFSSAMRFSLPDQDVFGIDASQNPPALIEGMNFAHVGTTLFNMAVHPTNGNVYVANLESFNEDRFEGPGTFGGKSLRGHLAESRITVLNGMQVDPRHLNKHIDYSTCCAPIPNPENETSLAFPLGMAISSDGKKLYVAAFGSSKIGVYDTAALDNDSFVPDRARQIAVSGGGPSGVVLSPDNRTLFALTRFDNSISVVDLTDQREVAHVAMYNPEPAHVVRGRRFLYDAALSSSHGDSACASCHIFGDLDQLAWDLGDPDTSELVNAGPFKIHPAQLGLERNVNFRPLKGPMTTQSLRGMANHGPMHWRGDRRADPEVPSVQPDQGAFDELTAFIKFSPAFVGLLGRHEELPSEDMRAFAEFILESTYPPNPVRNLDNSLTPVQAAGQEIYLGSRKTDAVLNCNGCHVLDLEGNLSAGVSRPGFFGTDGQYSFENEPQILKIPHLRNMYQKVGMFGTTRSTFFAAVDDSFKGPQIRGFGFSHDGSAGSLSDFFGAGVFVARPPGALGPADPGNPDGFAPNATGFGERHQVEAFLLAFPSNLAPIVGQQVTIDETFAAPAIARYGLLKQRAEANECDLIAKGGKREAGYLYVGDNRFLPDRTGAEPLRFEQLRRRIERQAPLTFTCVPPGSGHRMALDRDQDGELDGDRG